MERAAEAKKGRKLPEKYSVMGGPFPLPPTPSMESCCKFFTLTSALRKIEPLAPHSSRNRGRRAITLDLLWGRDKTHVQSQTWVCLSKKWEKEEVMIPVLRHGVDVSNL